MYGVSPNIFLMCFDTLYVSLMQKEARNSNMQLRTYS